LFINTYQFKPEDVDCKFCTEYRSYTGCAAKACPWIAERIEAGVVDYADVVRQTLPGAPKLEARLHKLVQRFPGSLFLDPEHRQRMEARKGRMGYRRKRDTPAYYAAMYLLTANQELDRRSANCFCNHGIEFDYATVKGISPQNYTLLSAARDIYADASRVMLSDLADEEIVDTVALSLIVNALMIARFGPAVLNIRERSKG